MDDSRVRVLMDEARKDRLFVEGERDAARDDLAIARDHLEAANNAHMEAEADLASARAQLASLTIQRDAAEALARERLAELQTAPLARALDTVEALAILRDLVHGRHDEAPSMRDLIDRARKLVAP